MTREIIMGIDIGTSSVKTIIAERKKTDTMPYILGVGISPSHGLRKGVVVNPQDVSIAIKNSLNQALKTADVTTKNAIVSIGGTGIDGIKSKGSIAVSRADHEISENDLKRAINQSEAELRRSHSAHILNRDILHHFPISYNIDDNSVIGNPVGMKGEKLEVETLFITSLSQHVNSLLKSMDLANVTVEDVVADSMAMSHAILNKKEKEVGCLLVNIGGDTSSIVVFEEGGPISLEIFPIGSNHITYDIAQGLQILIDEADQLKISFGEDATIKRRLNSIIVPRLNDIFELVDGHLNKIKRNRLLPAGVILTGGGANLDGIQEVAKSSLKLPVQLSQPRFSGNSGNIINDPTWSVALGLCYLGLGDEDSPLVSSKGLSKKAKNVLNKCFKNFLP
ncbi:cell division protein FtsA [Patescibacteria group bacterium]